MFRKSAQKAFTLIELLVVIAIIAILAAILFPVFAQAREKARQISCLSNMKQIGTSLMMYTQDYDEYFPMRYGNGDVASGEFKNGFQQSWRDMIYPYIKNQQVFKCPSNPTAQKGGLSWNGTANVDGWFPGGYSMWLPDAGICANAGHGCSYPQAIAGIPASAESIVVIETSYRWADTGPYFRYCEPANGPDCKGDFDGGTITSGPSSWNSGHNKKKSNIVYMDGHAKYTSLRATFEERTDGLNAWRYNQKEMDAAGWGWISNLKFDLANYPGEN
jgi:hypothetical protein